MNIMNIKYVYNNWKRLLNEYNEYKIVYNNWKRLIKWI